MLFAQLSQPQETCPEFSWGRIPSGENQESCGWSQIKEGWLVGGMVKRREATGAFRKGKEEIIGKRKNQMFLTNPCRSATCNFTNLYHVSLSFL